MYEYCSETGGIFGCLDLDFFSLPGNLCSVEMGLEQLELQNLLQGGAPWWQMDCVEVSGNLS